MRSEIKIESPEEKEIVKALATREDAEAKRISRFLKMPDLTRSPESPLYELMERIKATDDFNGMAGPQSGGSGIYHRLGIV